MQAGVAVRPGGGADTNGVRHSAPVGLPARAGVLRLQIYEAVAADSYDASWTGISSMVYKLRRKLGAGIIETVRGHGYKFVSPGTSPK